MRTVDVLFRACYFCGASPNPVFLTEPMERRSGRPVLRRDTYVGIRCLACGALYVDTDVTDAELRELYESETEGSVREILGTSTHGDIVSLRLPEFERAWRQVRKFRAARQGDYLLDVGCQTGEFGSIVKRSGVRVAGVELSEEYAESARAAWGPDGFVHTAGLEDAPFVRSMFQYVTAFETLEHLRDPIAALSRIRQWLDDGGLLAISVPSAQYFFLKVRVLGQSWAARLLRFLSLGRFAVNRGLIPHTHLYTFSARAVQVAFERAGFRVIFMGVTGWHGKAGPALNQLASIVAWASRQRVMLSPSILAIGVPLSPIGDATNDPGAQAPDSS